MSVGIANTWNTQSSSAPQVPFDSYCPIRAFASPMKLRSAFPEPLNGVFKLCPPRFARIRVSVVSWRMKTHNGRGHIWGEAVQPPHPEPCNASVKPVRPSSRVCCIPSSRHCYIRCNSGLLQGNNICMLLPESFLQNRQLAGPLEPHMSTARRREHIRAKQQVSEVSCASSSQ